MLDPTPTRTRATERRSGRMDAGKRMAEAIFSLEMAHIFGGMAPYLRALRKRSSCAYDLP
jgi:hypothetical protein